MAATVDLSPAFVKIVGFYRSDTFNRTIDFVPSGSFDFTGAIGNCQIVNKSTNALVQDLTTANGGVTFPTADSILLFANRTSSPGCILAAVAPLLTVNHASAHDEPPRGVAVPDASAVACHVAASRSKLSASTTVIFHALFSHAVKRVRSTTAPVTNPCAVFAMRVTDPDGLDATHEVSAVRAVSEPLTRSI